MPAPSRSSLVAVAIAAVAALTACAGPASSSADVASGIPSGAASSSAPSASTAAGTATPGGGSASSGGTPSMTPNAVPGMPDAQVITAAAAAFAKAPSVRVRGTVTSGGTKIRFDLQVGTARTGRGSVTLDGARFDVIATRKAVYLGGNDAFWKQSGGKSATNLFRGKYVRTDRKDPSFRAAANLLPPSGLTGTGTQTVDGVPARVLEDGAGGRYAVATVGEPYPLLVQGTDGGDRIDLTFDRYGAAVDLSAPPAGDVVDVRDFRG